MNLNFWLSRLFVFEFVQYFFLICFCCTFHYSSADVDLKNELYLSTLNSDERITGQKLPLRIAIVGGGIGGTSAAYFMRQLFGSTVHIDVYESSEKLCGRVSTVKVNNRMYESGASIIHGKNMYAHAAAKMFGLKEASSPDQTVGFFDGKDYTLQTSEWTIVTLLKFLWAFGLDFFRLSWIEDKFIDTFLSIYQLHEKGHSYTSVKDFLQAMDGDVFINASKITSCQFFKENGFHDAIIDNLVNGGLRGNYGQTCAVNGFVGMVSMAGIQPNLWSLKGGNDQFCEKFLEHSKAVLLNEKVISVIKSSEREKSFDVLSVNSQRNYDIVVIATPINRDKSHIDVTKAFTGKGSCPSAATDPRHYQTTIATFVKGQLNSTLFKCDSLPSCPGAIFTVKDLFFNSVGWHVPVDFDPKTDDPFDEAVYKVFSPQPLTEQQLSTLFEKRTVTEEVRWEAYPYYSPPDRLDTFVLNDDGLYYTSPIEWAASAMEMSMISAKNVALLAFNKWNGIEERVNADLNERNHSEL